MDAILLKRCRTVLGQCLPLDSHRELLAIFADERIRLWRDGLPEGDNREARLALTIDYLANKKNWRGDNGLLLLGLVLLDRVDPQDSRYEALLDLCSHLRGGRPAKRLALFPPAPPEPFIGQAALRQTMGQTLREGRGQVQALVGMGGVGKTSLAAQLVADIGDYFSRVLWVSLENNPTAESVWQDLLVAYNQPPSYHLEQAIVNLLNQEQPLLVLDNAETAQETTNALLERKGRATVLVTSRDRPFIARGTQLTTVPPLEPKEAIALFLARTGVKAEVAIGQLCQELGGLPLAIELAASYINSYGPTPAEYLAELRDSSLQQMVRVGEGREKSVAASFELSLQQLDENSRKVLEVLVIDGGETTGLAAVAAGSGLDDKVVKKGVNDLYSHSLIDRVNGRLQLHPLLRRYAIERQSKEQQETTRQKLGAYYLTFAEQHNKSSRADFAALEGERSNVLAAMTWAYEGQQWPIVRRFAWALCLPVSGYLGMSGYWVELRQRLEQAVRAAEAEKKQWQIAAFTHNLATVVNDTGDYTEAGRLYRQSLQIKEEVGNRPGIAKILHNLGLLSQNTGDYAEAGRLYRQSLQMYEEVGDRPNIAKILHNLGLLAQDTGDYAEADRLYRQSQQLYEEVGDRPGMAFSLQGLANLAKIAGNKAEAEQLYRQAMGISQEVGDIINEAWSANLLALLYEKQGRLAEALPLLQQAVAVGEKAGHWKAKEWRGNLERLKQKLEAGS